MPTCHGKTVKGDLCKAKVKEGELYCFRHKKQEEQGETALIPIVSPIRIPSPRLQITSDCIRRSKVPLKPHQIKVINYMRRNRGLIVAHSVGSGKTLTAIGVSQCFLDDNPSGRVIVVTPTSLVENFKKEMVKYGISSDHSKYNFYTLQKFSNEIRDNKLKCTSNDLLIIDEAHNLRTVLKGSETSKSKTLDNVRAYSALKCALSVSKVLLLSGSVFYNEPADITNLVSMIKGERINYNEVKKITQESSREQMKELLRGMISYYETPKDGNYPSVVERNIEIPMTNEYYEEYMKVERKESAKLIDGFRGTVNAAFMTGVRQASNNILESLKADWVFNKILEGDKTLVFSNFISFGIEILTEKLEEVGIPFLLINGSLNQKERKEVVEMFNKNETKVLFITRAGGEGLDLKEIRNVIMFESSWNQAQRDQVIGRAVRYKSHESLPLEERVVYLYNIYVIKPLWTRSIQGEKPSADDYLRMLTQRKSTISKTFYEILKEVSI